MKRSDLSLFILMIVLLSLSITSSGHGEETHHSMVMDHCDNPSYDLVVTAGKDNLFRYDQRRYQVPKDTCVNITLVNTTILQEHDLQIDAVEGKNGIKKVHLHTMAGISTSMNIKTPDADTTFTMYCTMKYHDGMEAKLIVGRGNIMIHLVGGILIGVLTISAITITRYSNWV